MKVLFVYTKETTIPDEPPIKGWEDMSFGISYISSYIKIKKHKTDLVVLTHYEKSDKMFSRILEFKPDVVAFTAVASEYAFVKTLAQELRCFEHFKGITILGGVYATLAENKDEVAKDFDAMCVGEGEEIMLNILQELEKGNKPEGIYWSHKFLENIDLPFPDREIWKEWVENKKPKIITILSGRGCPYRCSYCSNHALQRISTGRYVRVRSVEDIVREIQEIKINYPTVDEIIFETEAFNLFPDWVSDLCDEIGSLGFKYNANFRPENKKTTDEMWMKLKQAGFQKIKFGAESGSERVRKEVLRRDYSNKEFKTLIEKLKGMGFHITLYNMIGLPTETPEEFLETIQMGIDLNPDHQNIFIFYPYEGTDLYRTCKQMGVLPKISTLERFKAKIDYKTFSKKQFQKGAK